MEKSDSAPAELEKKEMERRFFLQLDNCIEGLQ